MNSHLPSYRGEAVGRTGMFAGLNGGNPAERVIALAARTVHSLAGVSCKERSHKTRIFRLNSLQL